MNWRLLITPGADARYNMALDQALFTCYALQKIPTLRIYSWQPHAVTIGRNQNLEETVFVDQCSKDNVDIIRRPSGGQAIFHADELTYSVVGSLADIGAGCSVKDSYRLLCSCVIGAYKLLGLDACFAFENKNMDFHRTGTNLCFAAREDYDILIDKKKIGGNAQRRKKDIIMQHGSIPYSFSYNDNVKYIRNNVKNLSECSTSLEECLGDDIDRGRIVKTVINSFKNKFMFLDNLSEITPQEQKCLDDILNENSNLVKAIDET